MIAPLEVFGERYAIRATKTGVFCQAYVHNKIRRSRRAAKLARKARQVNRRFQ